MANVKQKRGKKFTLAQKEMIVDFLEHNRFLIYSKTSPHEHQQVDIKWEELKNLLNNVENGSKKDVAVWKSTIADWKCKVKKSARQHKNEFKKTGGGDYISDALTPVENRLLKLYGVVSVVGCEDIPQEIDPAVEDEVIVENSSNTENLATTQFQLTEESNDNNDVVKSVEKLNNGGRIRKKVTERKRRQQINKLEESSQRYLESSTQIATSIESLSGSIKTLASSFEKIAEAIVVLATYKEYNNVL